MKRWKQPARAPRSGTRADTKLAILPTDQEIQREIAQLGVHGPYEDLAIAMLHLLEKIIDSQPKEIQADLWKAFLEDLKAWREFWKTARV